MKRTRALADGVWRARVDSDCGLVVNVYILRFGDQVALIDTGFPHTPHQLNDALNELGLGLSNVTDVLYTHTHIDHIGGGTALVGQWTPREWLWEGTAPAWDDVCTHIEATRTPIGWPEALLREDQRQAPCIVEIGSKPRTPVRVGQPGHLTDPRPVPFGTTVRVGDLTLECIDARGHDPYHCAWLERSRGWLFSGDVVLAVPTPFVVGMGDDIQAWLRTLHRWESSLDVNWLLPGHGMPTKLFVPSIARSRASIARVYDAVTDSLRAGPTDVLSIAIKLLPHDASRFAARTSTLVAIVEAILHALSTHDVVTCDGVTWRSTASLPKFESLAL